MSDANTLPAQAKQLRQRRAAEEEKQKKDDEERRRQLDRDEAELAVKIAALADAERKVRDRKAAQEALAWVEQEAKNLRERLASEAKDEADAARMSQEISELHKMYQRKERN